MKPEPNSDISHLIETAERLLAERFEKPLEGHEKVILAHVLAGEPLKNARAGGYKPSTIVKQIAPKLWNRLGEEVRCKNVRLSLETAAAHYRSVASLPEHSETDSLALTARNSQADAIQDSLKRILHNLPQRHYSKFIGRRQDIVKLLRLLKPKHPPHKICITGMGGVGKTSLALACAYQCLHASSAADPIPNIPIFDLIIFVSAKQQVLDCDGLHQRRVPQSTDLLWQIISMLDRNELLINETPATSLEEQIALIYRVLEKYQTLLILDNLEAVENQQNINDFLCYLPSSVKSILTTREGNNGEPIRLTPLQEEDGLNLVDYQAGHTGVRLSNDDRMELYDMTGGLPLAIHLVIGQLYRGRSIQRVREQLHQPVGHLIQYCFKASVESIQSQPAYWLLLSAALFPGSASRDALIKAAFSECDPCIAEDALMHLQTLSLIIQENISEFHSRYRVIAPLRAYLYHQLQIHPEFERAARERWLTEYLKLSKKYAGQDPNEWQGQFEGLDQEWENIVEVAKWAMDTGCYPELLQLWQNLKSYFYMVGRGANGMRFWQIGMEWAVWLTNAALQRQDQQSAGELMFFRAWIQMEMDPNNADTLLRTNELKTNELLDQAWELRQNQSQKDQANIARQIGLLKFRQRQFDQARNWLQQSEEMLQNASLDHRKHLECLSYTHYYQGLTYLEVGEFDMAKPYFEKAYEHAKAIQNDRAVQIIETSLADVAIHQRDFKLAKSFLDKGLQIANTNADRKRVAAIKYSLAKLAHAEGNATKKRREATESIQIFEQLGSFTKAQEVRLLLKPSVS